MSDTAVAIRQESGALTGRSSSGVPPAPKLSDALDNPDFDAVKFLNDMFPTGGDGSYAVILCSPNLSSQHWSNEGPAWLTQAFLAAGL